MHSLIKLLRHHQLETYLLIILPTIWILISGLYAHSVFTVLLASKKELALWSFFYGGKVIYFGLLILYIYFYLRLMIGVGCWVSRRIFNDTRVETIKIKKFFFSFIYLLLVIGMANLALTLSLAQIGKISLQEDIIHSSELYMLIDKEMWGVIPQLWIQQFSQNHLFDYLLIKSYSKISFFLVIIFLGLLLFKQENFRKFILAFFIAFALAMPFWYWLPAITPDEMYRQNLYSLKSVVPIQQQFKKSIKSKNLKTYLGFMKRDPEQAKQHPRVSTNPSMHVAWGAMITYYAIVLWWPLGFIYIPWLVLNMISTVYIIQHYVIDLPFGLILAAIAIIITNYLFKIERKYYIGKYTPFYFINVMQSDMQFLKTRFLKKM